jgi:aspartyl/glutamyl-tRNA(Asn/Gln) amidotransferase C subunit
MISKEDIEGLANLARLKLKDGEAQALEADINSILAYVGQISSAKIATDSLQGDRRGVYNVMREDAPREATDPLLHKEAAIIAQFPKSENNYNVVRKIIQKDE